MTCNNCGHTNPSGRLRCEECNAPLEGSMVANAESITALSGEVRCNNCNARNPIGTLRCKECNVPLDGSMVIDNVPKVKPGPNPRIVDRPISSETVRTGSVTNQILPTNLQCIRCGYPNLITATSCTQCGSALERPSSVPTQQQEVSRQVDVPSTPPPPQQVHPLQNQELSNATINPWLVYNPQPKKFELRPIAKMGEDEMQSLEFTENHIELNRDNLDAANPTITSKVQAVIEWRDGQWYISNGSEQHTTFIRLDEDQPLKSGSILLFGDRMFEFTCK